MTLVTLHRRAPVAPGATGCQLCDISIEGTYQDHLQVGQPGSAGVNGVICARCGGALSRLIDLYGKDLSFLVQSERPTVDNLIGGPAVRSALAVASAESSELATPSFEDQAQKTRRRGVDGAEHRRAEQT